MITMIFKYSNFTYKSTFLVNTCLISILNTNWSHCIKINTGKIPKQVEICKKIIKWTRVCQSLRKQNSTEKVVLYSGPQGRKKRSQSS
jgi:hypothetical protein